MPGKLVMLFVLLYYKCDVKFGVNILMWRSKRNIRTFIKLCQDEELAKMAKPLFEIKEFNTFLNAYSNFWKFYKEHYDGPRPSSLEI
jgi:hypothetical protein